jgi:NAD(P)-dependent dehydrogenase (short-subunit alcohol dehydrogenase family)
MPPAPWTPDDIPDQTGRVAVVTGASSGIGLEIARILAHRGAHVILGCRHPERTADALDRIDAEGPAGSVTAEELDLADLGKIAAFARAIRARHKAVDLLVNNAGVMFAPRERTLDGFEPHFGVNHLGHFALTGRLLPLMRRRAGARIVVVTSSTHRRGRVRVEDLNWERRPYHARAAYRASKLANLLFALELQRRLVEAGSRTRVVAAHVGRTATRLRRRRIFGRLFGRLFAMRPSEGALSALRAATDPNAEGGTFWGPSERFERRGAPEPARIGKRALNRRIATKLWRASEELTGVAFSFPEPERRRAARRTREHAAA